VIYEVNEDVVRATLQSTAISGSHDCSSVACYDRDEVLWGYICACIVFNAACVDVLNVVAWLVVKSVAEGVAGARGYVVVGHQDDVRGRNAVADEDPVGVADVRLMPVFL
jgi:hypothetical protein